MSDLHRRRRVALGHSPMRAWLAGFVVFVASAAISGAVSPGGSAGAEDATSAHTSRAPASVSASTSRGVGTGVGTGGDSGIQAAGPASASVPHTAVHTMSMDAPIQGGLTAHQEQALSARLLAAHQDATTAPRRRYWTPAMGRTAAARAQSWLGMPYSWAGGDAAGPTPGQCDAGTGGDLDCHVVGFDCSGLVMYAWGAYAALPHLADAQRAAGAFHPSLKQLLPGDLVFFSAYLPGGTGHVAIYLGKGMVVEAPQSGSVIRRASLADLMAADGTYRGAVRPLTGQTPTLSAPRATVPRTGGTVTLRGAHLAGVTAVHLGTVVVRHFVRQSDSAIEFRAPAHAGGTVAVTASTSWQAESKPVTLTYAKPRPATPASSPTKAASPSHGSSSPAPTAPPSSSTPPPSTTPPSSSTPPTPSTTTKAARTTSTPAPAAAPTAPTAPTG